MLNPIHQLVRAFSSLFFGTPRTSDGGKKLSEATAVTALSAPLSIDDSASQESCFSCPS